ncbi:MAG: hypothetical protein MAG715_01303 [Methanonatronarchaeales archaeon]|nr:hypothetical protein [Methanonatronarchaeales archaeon]
MGRYIDLGARTEEAYEISKRSRELARSVIGDDTPEHRVKQRASIATGDLGFADLMRFTDDAVESGVEAVLDGRDIHVDITMMESGVTTRGHGCRVVKALGRGDDIAEERGITRTAAGFLALDDRLTGSVVVIGNAPSGALALCDLVEDGVRPALVVATPVGFVNARESKDLIHGLDVPSITNVGTRGGTAVAVAAINEVITMAYQRALEDENSSKSREGNASEEGGREPTSPEREGEK